MSSMMSFYDLVLRFINHTMDHSEDLSASWEEVKLESDAPMALRQLPEHFLSVVAESIATTAKIQEYNVSGQGLIGSCLVNVSRAMMDRLSRRILTPSSC
jgi:hypothetical protein